jgi:hypothetical protein
MIKIIARIIAFVVSIFWFWFAIESMTGISDFVGLIPWILLLLCSFIAYSYKFVGGILIILFGIVSFFFFNAFQNLPVLLGLSIPLMISGALFIIDSRK